jgi:hypothetical protein
MPPTPDPASPSQSIPEYALRHAPIVWLHKGDEFLPSHVVEHLQHVSPTTFAGVHVDVPADIKNKVKALTHPDVNKGDVFLTLDVRCASTHLDISPRRSVADYTYLCICSSQSRTRLIGPPQKDVRENPGIPELQTPHCKPDSNGKSHSPCFIIVGDKSTLTPGCVDVFYFCKSSNSFCSQITSENVSPSLLRTLILH